MIILKSKEEIFLMRKAGKIAAETMKLIKKAIRPGVETIYLDKIAEKFILSQGARPSFKGYRGFPFSICTSLNEEVVHGIPSHRRLKEGDIIKIDLGVEVDGYNGDLASSFPVGKVSEEAFRLIRVTKEALEMGISQCIPGNHLSDISYAIQSHTEKNGYSVVRQFVGHGIGQAIHEDPQIPNFGTPGKGPRLEEGMVFALEPMVNLGQSEVEILSDNWTVVTCDRKLSAHFEHTVAITSHGPLILTA